MEQLRVVTDMNTISLQQLALLKGFGPCVCSSLAKQNLMALPAAEWVSPDVFLFNIACAVNCFYVGDFVMLYLKWATFLFCYDYLVFPRSILGNQKMSKQLSDQIIRDNPCQMKSLSNSLLCERTRNIQTQLHRTTN